MGCVSSNLLNREDEFTQLSSSALSHHIVSLTSTTYGLLNLDPPPPQPTTSPLTPPPPQPTTTPLTPPPPQPTTTPLTPPPQFTLGSTFNRSKSLWSEPRPVPTRPEIINSWELMSGIDTDSFCLSPLNRENMNPNFIKRQSLSKSSLSQKENAHPNLHKNPRSSLLKKFESQNDTVFDKFDKICPPNGENRVVIYTTTLRGIRKTFENCNAVRSVIESYGIAFCERDISMDRGFREELKELMRSKENETTPPRVFIKGYYIGGAEEVMRIIEEGSFGDLIKGLPKKKAGEVCDGCGDVRFLPCFRCNGSCKLPVEEEEEGVEGRRTVVIKCSECNENGLVHCLVCS